MQDTRNDARATSTERSHAYTAEVMRFWRAVLGYGQVGDEGLLDPRRRGPSPWFQRMDATRPQRNRIHVDVSVPHDEGGPRATGLGEQVLSDGL
ncbi:VOC family protein [Actinosynnema sp. NPDC049800]